MTADEQRTAARRLADQNRRVNVELRRRVKTGEVTIAEILANPPAHWAHVPMIDVIRRVRGRRVWGSGTTWLERLGRAAVRDDVNVFMPVGRASTRSRERMIRYAAENLIVHPRRTRTARRDQSVAA
jgi:hypothetical protein